MRFSAFTLAAFGLCAAQPALAGDLTGTVSDAAALPVSGMTVSLPALGLETQTDADGAYRFVNLPEGDYEIAFSLDDAAVQFSAASVPAEGETQRNIFLLSSAVILAARTGMSPQEAAEAARIEREAMEAADAMLREADARDLAEVFVDSSRG